MPVRPFRLLGAAVLETVQATGLDAWRRWCADWAVAPGAVALDCARPADGPLPVPADWRQQWRAGEGSVWLAWPAEFESAIQRAVFAPDANHAPVTPRLATEGGQAALAQLLQQLASTLLGSAEARRDAVTEPDAALFARGAGTLVLRLTVGKHSLRCLIGAEAVEHLAANAPKAPAPAKLAPLNLVHVLRDTVITLPVRAGNAELGLGSLLTVGVGDVIALDNPIDDTVTVHGPGGRPLFEGYLGQVDGVIAVEMSSRSASSRASN